MAQKKVKRSLWKSLWKDKATRTSFIGMFLIIALIIAYSVIPRQETIIRDGHTLQVYSSEYAPVHDPLMCEKCKQEKATNKDSIEDKGYEDY